MKTDVLFIHPGNSKKTYQDLINSYTAIAPPSWTSLLAAYVNNKGYFVSIHDVNIEGFDAKREIEKYNPKLIVIMVYGHQPSASTQTMTNASIIINEIKKYNKNIPIAIGGTHPSALPEITLKEEKVDYVIVGEGAYQIISILEYLNGKKNIKEILGVWFRYKSFLLNNKPAELIKDLDLELNDYAFELLPDLSKYRAHNFHCFGYEMRSPYISMNTSLGCPYNCDFCCINALFGKPCIRYWSVDTVIQWINELVHAYNIKHIRFDDELFILDTKRVELLCDKLIERNYDLNIWAYARVDTINEKLLKKMRKAGFNWLCLGIESANEKVRIGVNKRINKDIKYVVKSIKENGINIQGNYMFGLPDDSLETMQETLDLSIDLNCEHANFYCTMPYPGSKLYEQHEYKLNILPESWNGYSQYSYETKPLPTKYLSASDVLRFRDNAFYEYFSNNDYLCMIHNKFGIKFVNEIQDMLKIKIKRNILSD